jgi:hypothetical protein
LDESARRLDKQQVGNRLFLGLFGIALIALLLLVMLAQAGITVERSSHDLTIALPYLANSSMTLYRDLFTNHPPVLIGFLALIYRFFEPITTLRALNIAYILFTASILFWTTKRLWGTAHGWGACLFYLLWSIPYNSLLLYLDGLVGMISACILLLATYRRSSANMVAIGILAGLGAVLKQNALLILIFTLAWVLWEARAARRSLWRLSITPAAALFTFVLPYVVLWLAGVGDDALAALFNAGNSRWLFDLRANFLDGHAWRSVLVTLTPIPTFILISLRDLERRRFLVLLTLLFLATMVLNVPALGYYHFMAPLPVVALAAGVAFGEAWNFVLSNADGLVRHALFRQTQIAERMLLGGMLGYGLVIAVFVFTPMLQFFVERVYLIGWEELEPVSAWIVTHTEADERILVLPTYDSNGNIYAQAGRLPPYFMKNWIHHASVPDNAERFQSRLEAQPPSVIVFFPDLYASVETYFPRLNEMMETEYTQVGMIDEVPFYGSVIFLRRQ